MWALSLSKSISTLPQRTKCQGNDKTSLLHTLSTILNLTSNKTHRLQLNTVQYSKVSALSLYIFLSLFLSQCVCESAARAYSLQHCTVLECGSLSNVLLFAFAILFFCKAILSSQTISGFCYLIPILIFVFIDALAKDMMFSIQWQCFYLRRESPRIARLIQCSTVQLLRADSRRINSWRSHMRVSSAHALHSSLSV